MAGFLLVVSILAALVIWFSSHLQQSAGLPAIEATIDQQLIGLAAQSPALSGIFIGPKTKRHVRTENDVVSGYFEYNALKEGSTLQLVVYWEKDLTHCDIESVKIESQDSPPKILWRGTELGLFLAWRACAYLCAKVN